MLGDGPSGPGLRPKFDAFPRTVSCDYDPSLFDSTDSSDANAVQRSDIGIFWDLRRYHLGAALTTTESIIVAIKYNADMIRHFCSEWLGLNGLNVSVKFALVCDLPHTAGLEMTGRSKIIQAFDEYEIQFSNVSGNNNVPVARREGICRFVHQFMNDFPRPLLVVISDDLRLFQSVRNISGDADIVPIITRNRQGRATDGQCRRFFNKLLADSIVRHPWDIYFYETVIRATIKDRHYPKNSLQILYSTTRDTRTLKTPLFAFLMSFILERCTLYVLRRYVSSSSGMVF